jgi:glyceraldehyde 3-phosphate dehydrogenase
MVKIGINGFGRIGRACLKILRASKKFQVVAINDIDSDINNLAYLLKYDSIYGKYDVSINVNEKGIAIEDDQIDFYSEKEITSVPWKEHHVDIVIDASGVRHNVLLSHELVKFDVKKVIITHASKEVDLSLIFGVNDKNYDSKRHHVISTSICDANAIAPVLKILEDKIGIESGFITTLHPWLSYQNLLDAPVNSISNPGHFWKDYSLGRASPMCLIPKETTALTATFEILPMLKDKLESMSFRVPTMIVTTSDMVLNLKKETTPDELIKIFEDYTNGNQNISINKEPLVSIDFKGTSNSAIVDARYIKVVDRKTCKIIIWYDNEWGYSSQVVNAAGILMKSKEIRVRE